jgi:hypothetical protein
LETTWSALNLCILEESTKMLIVSKWSRGQSAGVSLGRPGFKSQLSQKILRRLKLNGLVETHTIWRSFYQYQNW